MNSNIVNILNKTPSLFCKYITEIRDKNIQQDALRFRKNLERIGELMAFEISKTLTYTKKIVETPLGIAKEYVSEDKIVLATIFRAGLPLHQGMLNYFDDAQNAFVSAYRKPANTQELKIKVEYVSSPDLTDKILILCDPMLATAYSMVASYQALIAHGGVPKSVHFVTAIASQPGIDYLKNNIADANACIWAGAVDEKLNNKAYIIPGLGDAGDLAFGEKI